MLLIELLGGREGRDMEIVIEMNDFEVDASLTGDFKPHALRLHDPAGKPLRRCTPVRIAPY